MHWKCPECGVINKLKKNSSERCPCGFVPYNSSDFMTELPIYVVKVSAPDKENLAAIASQLHGDVDCDLDDIEKRLSTGTTFNTSFDNEEAATQFADKYRLLNCNVQIIKEAPQTQPACKEQKLTQSGEPGRFKSKEEYFRWKETKLQQIQTAKPIHYSEDEPKWFYAIKAGDAMQGPVSIDILSELFNTGEISASARVCVKGQGNWQYLYESPIFDKLKQSNQSSAEDCQIAENVACPHCEELIPKEVSVCSYCAEEVSALTEAVKEVLQKDNPENSRDGNVSQTPVTPAPDELKRKLAKLTALQTGGIITDNEFKAKREQLINTYLNDKEEAI